MTEAKDMHEPTDSSYTKMTAEIYDALYAGKDYEREVKVIDGLIEKYKQTDGNELLDVACGTGAHLRFLKDKYQIVGVDLSEQQIEEAKKRLPDLRFIQGDMRDFDLGKQFDVITSLFSGIGYVHPLPEMKKAVSNMSRHLKPGGVLIVEPWLQPGVFDPAKAKSILVGHGDGFKVTRTGRPALDGNISILDMHHKVERPEGVTEFTEEHRLAMYTSEEYQQAFEGAGLSFEHLDISLAPDRGIYIGTKPVAQ